MRTNRKHAVWPMAAALASVLIVSGCGDNYTDSTPPSATSQVPSSASQSIAGFIGYLQELVVSSADTLEPVDTSMVSGPTDETSEPLKVD